MEPLLGLIDETPVQIAHTHAHNAELLTQQGRLEEAKSAHLAAASAFGIAAAEVETVERSSSSSSSWRDGDGSDAGDGAGAGSGKQGVLQEFGFMRLYQSNHETRAALLEQRIAILTRIQARGSSPSDAVVSATATKSDNSVFSNDADKIGNKMDDTNSSSVGGHKNRPQVSNNDDITAAATTRKNNVSPREPTGMVNAIATSTATKPINVVDSLLSGHIISAQQASRGSCKRPGCLRRARDCDELREICADAEAAAMAARCEADEARRLAQRAEARAGKLSVSLYNLRRAIESRLPLPPPQAVATTATAATTPTSTTTTSDAGTVVTALPALTNFNPDLTGNHPSMTVAASTSANASANAAIAEEARARESLRMLRAASAALGRVPPPAEEGTTAGARRELFEARLALMLPSTNNTAN